MHKIELVHQVSICAAANAQYHSGNENAECVGWTIWQKCGDLSQISDLVIDSGFGFCNKMNSDVQIKTFE